jgi:integrase/recombinase XerD
VQIYRRHKSTCKHRGDISKKCRCTLWATGVLEGKPFRRSLKTRNYERAEQIVAEIEVGKKKLNEPKGITVQAAIDAYFTDCEARNLKQPTIVKYRRLANRLLAFCQAERKTVLTDLTVEVCGKFRGTWNFSPRTNAKELARLRAFFSFAVSRDWLPKNPARSLTMPSVPDNPTLPFTDSEVSKLFAHADFRTTLFFRVLLHSGLRIIDAAHLRPERIENGKIFLYQQKTGVPVRCPLPPDLVADLAKQPTTGGFYFVVQSDNFMSVAEYYRQKLAKAGNAAGVENARPHRFRDTFAVRLLEKGVALETVSILLGHTDIKTTQKSYAPWVQSLQSNLELAVQKTWDKPALRRVK